MSDNLLIVVDYQVDFVTGALGFPEAKAIEEAVCNKIQARSKEGYDIIFTFDTHEPDYLSTREGRKLPVSHCQRGSEGWNLYGRTAELLRLGMGFEKNAFGSLELAQYLRDKKYRRVELIGVVTQLCVLSCTVLAAAALPESDIIVDAACCASPNGPLHESALDVLEALQITVANRKI